VIVLKATKTITIDGENSDQRTDINIIRTPLHAHLRQMADTAGVDKTIIANRELADRSATFG
jgi:hypothetical protein